ncbi:MAG: hypothetical protein AAFO95_05850 [Cyanobacteria bacterium J06600_6]
MIRDIAGSTGDTVDRNYSVVYEYLQHSAAVQPPSELIRRFQNLLQNGKNTDAKAYQAFEKIVFAQGEQFNFFLSQCFYLILAVWLDNPESSTYIGQLLDIPNSVANRKSYDRRRKEIIGLVKRFQQSQSYQQLRLMIDIIQPREASVEVLSSFVTNESKNELTNSKTPSINSYLIRYPFLYKNLLPTEIAVPNLVEKIAELQNSRQKDFEIKLSQHIIYRFRLKQLAKMRMMAKGAGKIIVKAENPSWLSEKSFYIALKQYVGKQDKSGSTLQERAQFFLAENKYRQTYSVFKQDLYRFLVKGIKPRNSTYQFESRFKEKLDSIFRQANEKPLNPTQILQTCRQLFSFLIVDSTTKKEPERFVELVANLGTAQVAMLLIKIVLICPESKADLSRKIYLIVERYQEHTVKEHLWLLKTLEHLLIAFSLYFGSVDVSIAKSVVSKP